MFNKKRMELANWYHFLKISGFIITGIGLLIGLSAYLVKQKLNEQSKIKLIEFENKIQDVIKEDREVIRNFEVDVKIVISGNWKSSPANMKLVTMNEGVYYAALLNSNEKDNIVYLYVDNIYNIRDLDETHVEFSVKLTAVNGDLLMGKSYEVLKDFDAIQVWVPIVEDDKVGLNKVIFDEVNLVFHINNSINRSLVQYLNQEVNLIVPNDYMGQAWAEIAFKIKENNFYDFLFME